MAVKYLDRETHSETHNTNDVLIAVGGRTNASDPEANDAVLMPRDTDRW